MPAWSLTGSVFGMHATRGEAAGDRRRRAGGDRLLVLLPRLAQVHVHVDQPGRDDPALALISNTSAPSRGRSLSTTRDPAVLDQHVELAVPPGGRDR